MFAFSAEWLLSFIQDTCLWDRLLVRLVARLSMFDGRHYVSAARQLFNYRGISKACASIPV